MPQPNDPSVRYIKPWLKIGSGSFGHVYKAYDSITSQYVAIKMIQLDVDTVAEIDDIQHEIEVLSTCQHTNIVTFYTSYIHNTALHIVLQYMNAGSVRTAIQRHGPLTEIQCRAVMYNLLRAVQYVHDNGYIHRDIKSANILLDTQCNVKITDFGVSNTIGNTYDKRNTFAGTPHWMAPEVIEQLEYSQSADIWSIGITCYEMVTGSTPFSHMKPMNAMFEITRAAAPSLSSVHNNGELKLSKQCIEFVDMCLHKNPNERPTVSQLLKHKFITMHTNNNVLADVVTSAHMNVSAAAEHHQTALGTGSSIGTWDFGHTVIAPAKPAITTQLLTVQEQPSAHDTGSTPPKLNTAPKLALLKLVKPSEPVQPVKTTVLQQQTHAGIEAALLALSSKLAAHSNAQPAISQLRTALYEVELLQAGAFDTLISASHQQPTAPPTPIEQENNALASNTDITSQPVFNDDKTVLQRPALTAVRPELPGKIKIDEFNRVKQMWQQRARLST